MFRNYARPSFLSSYYGPRDFEWLEQGLLAGCPQPGLLQDPALDLEALSRVGIKVLVTLTEEKEPLTEAIEGHGLKSIYLPIPDQCAPSADEARALCEQVDGLLKEGMPTAFHCRAGKGRTGTLLACMLIYKGASNEDAISLTKRRNPVWIESEEQMEFLRTLKWGAPRRRSFMEERYGIPSLLG
ncbi:protein-tyrosine phosphatase family protein [Celeribacter litoreus]|uniref:protein-tyrosine phosphatase family protein n=1 Tax=Celeribacter litoreus TaxID=2876714 RepID=UPI001CC96583|nr:dual specificity protein phosphatase family protein [Celeribacter litoreus]MCA0043872.1 dual specificity protein phosphatase family protein [Celeribacter litoreus]